MKTAAQIIRLSRSVMPAPAFTDFSRIFVALEANAKQEVLLIAHEQAHIWLNHRTRRPDDYRTADFDKKLWDTALEMEIALNIYDEDDTNEIMKPLTLLSGAYTKHTFPDMPGDITIAEEIYVWLKENPPETETRKFCSCPEHQEDGETAPEPLTAEEMEAVKEELVRLKEEQKRTLNKARFTPDFKKKPTLASSMDYVFRNRKTRRKGYLRPSRRESEPFILKGVKKTKKRPLVEIYVDRSGSMSGEKTGASVEKLKRILSRYRATVKNDVFYFSNDKLFPHDVPPNGSNPYPIVMEQISKNRPRVAVIITDYDETSTEGLKPLGHTETTILCVPVCADRTAIANLIGAIDVL